jgi:predicted permease
MASSLAMRTLLPRISSSLELTARDVQFAVRLLIKDRRFTIAAVLALGLGIGVNNSVFTLVNTALIRDLPFERPEELVLLRSVTNQGAGRRGMSARELAEYRAALTTFAGLGASLDATMAIAEEERAPERARGTFVSANLFPLLGRAPVLGRSFRPEDDRPGAPAVVVLGDSLWRTRYGADPGIVGRTIRVNDVPATVVGVMPPGFKYPLIAQLWQPLSAAPAPPPGTAAPANLAVIGRLAPGADRSAARTDLDRIAVRLAAAHPDTNAGVTISVEGLLDGLRQGTRSILLTLMAAVGFVLLTACANLAALLLSRAAHRTREIAIRLSLGATRWRIVRQLLIECVIIAGLAGVLGVALSGYGTRLIAVGFNVIDPGATAVDTTPYWVDLSMNRSAYLFVGMIALCSTFTFGLLPALHLSRTDVLVALKDGASGLGSAGARRWTSGLIIGQLALTMTLVTATALLWRNFIATTRAEVVIETSDLITARFTLTAPRFDAARRHRFFRDLTDRLTAAPPVSDATLAASTPFEPAASRLVSIEGRLAPAGQPLPAVGVVVTDDGYFRTLRLPIVRGRALTDETSLTGAAQAVVNQQFASTFFPEGEAIGQRLRLSENAVDRSAITLTIVGIARTIPALARGAADRPIVYVPWQAVPEPPTSMTVIARTTNLAASVVTLRETLRTTDAGVPLFGIEPMDAALARMGYPQRLLGTWFSLLAVIAVVLAVVGLYATTAHGVASRTKEIGVRMALGARAGQVLMLFMRQAIWRLGLGLLIGLGGALALGHLLSSFLVRVSARDPLTLTAVAILLALIGIAASFVPAARATRIEPTGALRGE